MTDATDLLASINKYPYHASTNPGGLADSGYLQESAGVSLVARAVRALGEATGEAADADPSASFGTAQTRRDTVLALSEEAAGYLATAEQHETDAQAQVQPAETAQSGAEAAQAATLTVSREAGPFAIRFY